MWHGAAPEPVSVAGRINHFYTPEARQEEIRRIHPLRGRRLVDLDQRLRAAVALVLAMGLATLAGGVAAAAAALPLRAACRRASVSAAFGDSTGALPGAGAVAPGLASSFFLDLSAGFFPFSSIFFLGRSLMPESLRSSFKRSSGFLALPCNCAWKRSSITLSNFGPCAMPMLSSSRIAAGKACRNGRHFVR